MEMKLRLFTYMALALATSLVSPSAQAASVGEIALYRGQDRPTRIEQGAKREGEVVWYTSHSVEDSAKVLQLFEKTYPSVKIKLTRLSSERVVQRYVTEFQANRPAADVVDTNFQMELVRRRNALQPYYTPSADRYDKRFRDPQGFWLTNRLVMSVLGYNTRLVPPSEAPKRYEELLNPKWRGKFSLEREETGWFLALMEHWGEEKGKSFFQALGAQSRRSEAAIL